jgi:tetratricopeptide (TPR) repeat protein
MTPKATLKALTLACVVALPGSPSIADGNAGAYLAARHASFGSDYVTAADYYARALVRDPNNISLMENATTALLGIGEIDRAVPIARRLVQMGQNNQIGNIVLFGSQAKAENWDGIAKDLDAGQTVGPLYDGLLRAWSLVGLGKMGDALEAFDAVSNEQGVQAFGLYHKALALASVGDFEGADRIFSGQDGPPLRMTRRGVVAHSQILSQLDRNADAVELIRLTFGENLDPALQALLDALEAGDSVAFDAITTATEGIAEVNFSIAGALSGEAADGYTLLYARMTRHLDPDNIDGLLLTAALLEDLERYELATQVYDKVPRDHPSFHAAEIGRANALSQAGNDEAAIEVLRQLSESHSEISTVHTTLGDTLRRLDRYEEAGGPYDKAVALIGEPSPRDWILFFSRGIAHEREDQWDDAEADFRKALELRPNQPQVMNYLGYSFLEMNTNLDEAMELIEKAVAAEPNSGYIIDSLGWGLYLLGRYDEAVEHMERAVELEAVDPIVNDHLGDVYWAVGRTREAEFQWARALSFDPEEEEADRIRRKLEVGLDAVLKEEGAKPLAVANDEG